MRPNSMRPFTMALYAVLSGYLLFTFYTAFIDLGPLLDLTREDGFFEYAGALGFLGASLFFLRAGVRQKTPMRYYYFIFSFLFFFAAGEEISWGQRILGLQVPELMLKYNRQHEINIHNLPIFHYADQNGHLKPLYQLLVHFNLVFYLFIFVYCGLFTILHACSNPAYRMLARLHIPVVPKYLAALFILNIIILFGIDIFKYDISFNPLIEIIESNAALLFMGWALIINKEQSGQSVGLQT